MKIGILSDSHGNRKNVERAAQMLCDDDEVRLLIHLGDDYRDAELLDSFTARSLRVPGIYAEEYQQENIPNRLLEKVGQIRLLLSHTRNSTDKDLPDDLDPDALVAAGEVDIILHGHSHRYQLEEENGVYSINPGHLKDVDEKSGNPPTCALLKLEPGSSYARITNLTGQILEELRLRF